jgi:hypothetical protein
VIPAPRFAFRDAWSLDAGPARVAAVLGDLEHYPDWWPEVRAVASLGPDDALVVCRSRLPYELELHLHAVHRGPDRLETTLAGDLEGSVRWLVDADGTGTRLRFEQDVVVRDRLLALASYAARRLLVWNHDRMMASAVDRLRAVL